MFLQLFCLAVVLANGVENHKVNAELISATKAIEICSKSWFPEDAEFNESCMSEGCPALNNFNLCPNNINTTVLYSVLNTAAGCMRKPVCGILIDERPHPYLTMTADEWLPDLDIDGVVTVNGIGSLTNISNIEFELLPDSNQTRQLPLQLAVLLPNLRTSGYFHLDLSLRTMLPSMFGQALSVTVPQAMYDIQLQFVSNIFINHTLTGSNFEIKFLNPIIKTRLMFCGFDVIPQGFPTILTTFTAMCQLITEKSSMAVSNAGLLEKYFQSAINTVTNGC